MSETTKDVGQSVVSAKFLDVLFPKPRGGLGPVTVREVAVSFLGAFCGIAAVAFLTLHYNIPLLAGSFGATAVLLYAAPGASMAQPRNCLGGHILSAIVGVAVYQLFGFQWWSLTLAVATAIAVMILTRTRHPPGGATAFIAVFSGAAKLGWLFVLTPIALGAFIMVVVALLTNRLSSERTYPTFWI